MSTHIKPVEIPLLILAIIGKRLLRAVIELLLMVVDVVAILSAEILKPLASQMERLAVQLEEQK